MPATTMEVSAPLGAVNPVRSRIHFSCPGSFFIIVAMVDRESFLWRLPGGRRPVLSTFNGGAYITPRFARTVSDAR